MARFTDLRSNPLMPLLTDRYTDDVLDPSIFPAGTTSNTYSVHGGNDTVYASAVDDVINDNDGGPRYITLFNGQQIFQSSGPSGNDTIYGRGGNDTIFANDGINIYDGGADTDTVNYSRSSVGATVVLGNGTLAGTGISEGSDTLFSIENVVATNFDDTVTGNSDDNDIKGLDGDDKLTGKGGDDTLDGGEGNDILIGGTGADWLIGSHGSDTVSYAHIDSGKQMTLSLQSGIGVGNEAQGDVYVGVENVVGSRLADIIIGDFADNVLVGSRGADTMTGGTGHDRFVFFQQLDSLVSAPDKILDFRQGEDTLDFSRLDETWTALTDFYDAPPPASMDLVSAFTGQAGEIMTVVSGGITSVLADLNGDGTADMRVDLVGTFRLTDADFWL